MATNQQIIDRALRRGGVIEDGDSANASESADALVILNSMMLEWKQSDKDFNWFTQDTLGAVCPIPDWAEKGIVANLTAACATDFRYPVTQDIAIEASKGSNVIARTLINLSLDNADMSHLPGGSGRRWRYNIETGY